MALPGADLDGLLRLAGDLDRAALDLAATGCDIDVALAIADQSSPAADELTAIHGWCRDQQADIVARAAVLAEANGVPIMVLLRFGPDAYDAVFGIVDGSSPAGATRADRHDPAGSWWPNPFSGDDKTLLAALDWLIDKPDVVRESARLARMADSVHRWLGPIGFAGDVHGVVDPPHDGVRGEVDRAVAGTSAVAFIARVVLPVVAPALGPVAVPVATAIVIGGTVYELASLAYDHRAGVGSAMVAEAARAEDRIEDLARLAADVGDTIDGATDRAADDLESLGAAVADRSDRLADEYEQWFPVGGPGVGWLLRTGGGAGATVLDRAAGHTRWLGDRAEDVGDGIAGGLERAGDALTAPVRRLGSLLGG